MNNLQKILKEYLEGHARLINSTLRNLHSKPEIDHKENEYCEPDSGGEGPEEPINPLGDFVMKFGNKMVKGHALKDIDPKHVKYFVEWADSQGKEKKGDFLINYQKASAWLKVVS